MKYLLSSLGAQVIKDFLRAGNVVAVMQTGIHDGNEISRGRVGVIKVVKLGVLVQRERCGEDRVRRSSGKEGTHIARTGITLNTPTRVYEFWVRRKKGRVGIWKGGDDSVDDWRAGAFCRSRV